MSQKIKILNFSKKTLKNQIKNFDKNEKNEENVG